MRCSNVIVPGLAESDDFLKGHQDIGMKIQRELDKTEGGHTFKILPNYKPKETVKAYKLFKVKNNKLYPLFVDSNRALPVGKWLEAEAGELTDQGKVKSSIGSLAFRPGWHSGDLPLATHIGGKVDPETGVRVKGSMPPNLRENNQAWAEIEVPADYDWQSVATSRAPLVKSGPNKGKPNAREAHITDQLPSKGYYKYKTNANMTGSWLISGELRINRILSDSEVRDINSEAGTSDLVRDYELPYMQYDIDRSFNEAELKKKHPGSIQTEWDDDKGYTDFKDTPQSPGFFAYEKASPATKRLADFASENGMNYRVNADGSITVEMETTSTDKVKRVKVRSMPQLRQLLGY
jgi:hypothetical protein